MTELGVFLPVGKNGYIVSAAPPQYQPSYAMLKAMTRLAEDLGFSLALSPVKYRGWGGPTEFADYVLRVTRFHDRGARRAWPPLCDFSLRSCGIIADVRHQA